MSAGVYKIVNKINGKQYIGSAVNFKKRWTLHRSELNNNKHHSIYLQAAWNKYGEAAFDFFVVHECLRENAVAFEQFYINELKPEYNMCRTAGSRLGMPPPNKGKKASEELRKKLSLAHIGKPSGNKGKVQSTAVRQKMSESAKNRARDDRKKHGLIISAQYRQKALAECGHEDWRKCKYCHRFDDTATMTSDGGSAFYHKNCRNEHRKSVYKKRGWHEN